MPASSFNWYFYDVIVHINSFVSSAVDWVLNFVSSVQRNPLLFIFVVVVPLAGLGISVFNRLIRAN